MSWLDLLGDLGKRRGYPRRIRLMKSIVGFDLLRVIPLALTIQRRGG